jgi:hypothetical protein
MKCCVDIYAFARAYAPDEVGRVKLEAEKSATRAERGRTLPGAGEWQEVQDAD